MANVVIAGMQWGDEGKGKIVDLICPAFDVVARFQGGHNAGHTVRFGDRHFSLHLIPSGVLHADHLCVLGNGMVVAPDAFLAEVARLRDAGVDPSGRLFASSRATAILPCHVELDMAREKAVGEGKIGTTSRGIGPAYESKASRAGVRLGDLSAPDLEDRLETLVTRIHTELASLGVASAETVESLAARCREWGGQLAPYLADTALLLHNWMEEGRSILFEGAQGTLLDIDHGTFPYVTSSNSTVGGAATGTGIPPTRIDGALGVLKAYTTRVGGGPFPTELDDKMGEYLRARGNEFGTTTGRPRRCGWLDLVAARYSQRLNGMSAIALTKLDVLDELDEIRVATHYSVWGEVVADFPTDRAAFAAAEPVYTTVPGWKRDTSGILDEKDLPRAARDYIDLIEHHVGAPVALVSTGPRREETILRDLPDLRGLLEGRYQAVLDQRGKL